MTEQSIRDELSVLSYEHPDGYRAHLHTKAIDTILDSSVIRRIQAEAIREAAEALNREFQDIPAWIEAYREGVRTDEWMKGGVRMVMSVTEALRNRADRIESADRG